MFKLMKLEMKKVKMGGYIKGAIIANIIIIAMLVAIIFVSKHEGEIEFTSILFTFSMVDRMVKANFTIFASVLIARFIIEEYKSNTITVLFMYPISRKKLIMAKLLIVVLFTFISTVLSNIFIDLVLCIINNFYNFTPDKLTSSTIIRSFMTIGINALASTGMGLIPLYFGMRKKSVPTTIVSSILIVSIVCSDMGGVSLSNIISISIALSIIGGFIAYLSIRNIEHIDAIK
ncbi:ABC transporter permease [Clostridium sp. CF011]|nr:MULTISPECIES: ABC transporter permease [unclassified Clostridium]MBU3091011.1 ABC transporter permease [Clostridium sp. CF011]MBW9144989.1 ABC transporter permease [Clostridium sp. CM027]UVE40125.1 ABC transporter permease [Clostridium sp. CM027]WAG69068.1 ABC transporter permease [Clostridium sp. CF011]